MDSTWAHARSIFCYKELLVPSWVCIKVLSLVSKACSSLHRWHSVWKIFECWRESSQRGGATEHHVGHGFGQRSAMRTPHTHSLVYQVCPLSAKILFQVSCWWPSAWTIQGLSTRCYDGRCSWTIIVMCAMILVNVLL